MAGIGFELKKAFAKKGVLNLFKAYTVSGVVVTGPMFLSISLLAGLRMILNGFGVSMTGDVRLMNSLITYTTLFSVVWVNIFSLVVIRYVSDKLYLEEYDKVMPSFYGSVAFLILSGGTVYGAFLFLMKIPLWAASLSLILFCIYVIVWSQINYLSAIKNYKGILVTFLLAVLCGVLSGFVIAQFFKGMAHIAVMISVIIAYGILAVSYNVLLNGFFPKGRGSAFEFMGHFSKCRELLLAGIFLQIGIYGHIVVMWFSGAGDNVVCGLRECGAYDLPSMLAFLTSVITIINISTSLEVNFYPYYHKYFNLLNKGGNITELNKAEAVMKRIMYDELFYCMIRQFFATLVCIVFGSRLLLILPIGMSGEMIGVFRVLCVGYALYASGYAFLLVLLYFNYGKVYVSLIIYGAASVIFTAFFATKDPALYGTGFVIAGMLLLLCTFVSLLLYLKKLLIHIFVGIQTQRS